MDQNPVLKRLYVGGLDYTVSEAELRERFCKFGNVTDTEIVIRKDEKGKPTKTFAYISISLSEKELRKCISALNKTKWKGGTLQIELAKECFLHRLARERHEASMTKENTSSNSMTNILDSMKKSGVEDFHLKAVPGTEIPDHKDWIVGKFGRVLPVLHMKARHTNKVMKYDPSKYCHNLKKLDSDLNERVPVSQLTWHLEEEDDIMSKKQQGQIPVSKKPPKKKMRVHNCDSLSTTEFKSCYQFSSKTTNVHRTELVQNRTCIAKQYKEPSADQKFVTEFCKKKSSLSESDIDTDEEIRAVIAKEKKVKKVNPNIEPEDDSMEVVGENFEMKYSTHWSLKKAHSMKKICNEALRSTEEKSDYDSADTDEIIAVTQISNQKKRRKKALNGSKATKENEGRFKKGIFSQATCSNSPELNGSTADKLKGEKRATLKKTNSEVAPEQSRNANKCKLESESEGDEDYETMMKNCYQLDLTLEDLERLAGENAASAKDDTEGRHTDTQSKTNGFSGSNTKDMSSAHTGFPTAKKCICPEEILAAILKESADEENPKKENSRLKVRPFRGIGSLSKIETIKKPMKDELDAHKSKSSSDSSEITDMGTLKSASDPQFMDTKTKNPNCKLISLRKTKSNRRKCTVKMDENSSCSTLNTEDSEPDTSNRSVLTEAKVPTNLKSFPKRTPTEISCKGSDLSKNLKTISLKSRQTLLGSVTTALEKQQDNEKRLAALQEKQKVREQQKRLIQGALAHLEIKSTNTQKHIVFDSDGESEAEVPVSTEDRPGGKLPGKVFTTKTSGKLFESSEDESDTAEDEDDRFKIKPQFEGKAGEKLMQLQARFGTDERFRMDARFLENDSETESEDELKKLEIDEEDELTFEKKKNLEILKNLLHINVEHPKPNKQAASARKFKDINTLRYDPTRQDHAVFERKQENAEKESKAKKKKKREKAQKLPEVSKEIFYDVAMNLREVLESTKCDEKPEIIPWDKHNVEDTIPADVGPLNKDRSNKQEESSGFTFSFFGAEEKTSPTKEEPYLAETIKPSKVAWQEDPRFQDSSSEDDDEQEEKEYVKEMSPAAPHSNIRFFFFSQDDDRLKEGPKLFCRSSNLEDEREDWESRRQMLLEDCRKKHKDARRKVKAKH
ncbi:nucleolar protein 8 [Heteronotia binoei]|uniref:nucleolar protein 8 n=1 Tax=Heteronotia binoei TaxID=13085 RepID=UPI002931773B|nr:nucleolar protein 8 [Heteronotia binoei]